MDSGWSRLAEQGPGTVQRFMAPTTTHLFFLVSTLLVEPLYPRAPLIVADLVSTNFNPRQYVWITTEETFNTNAVNASTTNFIFGLALYGDPFASWRFLSRSLWISLMALRFCSCERRELASSRSPSLRSIWPTRGSITDGSGLSQSSLPV